MAEMRSSSGIRLATEHDAPAIAAIYRPIVETTAISFETEPPDEHEMRRRIAETLTNYPWLVFERGSEIAGFAYASRHRAREAYRWSVDTSAYVDERFRRQGIAHGLYISLFAILSAQGFVNAYAGIALPNPASVALHERVGFTPVGVYRQAGYKLGAWRDVGWWQRRLRPADGPPPVLHGLDALRESREWPALLMSGLTAVRG
jgi:L-amino acid N-acyltransferase YncA